MPKKSNSQTPPKSGVGKSSEQTPPAQPSASSAATIAKPSLPLVSRGLSLTSTPHGSQSLTAGEKSAPKASGHDMQTLAAVAMLNAAYKLLKQKNKLYVVERFSFLDDEICEYLVSLPIANGWTFTDGVFALNEKEAK